MLEHRCMKTYYDQTRWQKLTRKRVLSSEEHIYFFEDATGALRQHLHRENGPATIFYDFFGKKSREEWWCHGNRHRENGPAIVDFDTDTGRVSEEMWFDYGEMHREDGPAWTQYITAGECSQVKGEHWWYNTEKHRDGGPATIKYHNNGVVSYKRWYNNGKCKRGDGPAIQSFNDDGSIHYEHWYDDGKKYSIVELLEYIQLSDEDKVAIKLAF